jgi:hypothetical protein
MPRRPGGFPDQQDPERCVEETTNTRLPVVRGCSYDRSDAALTRPVRPVPLKEGFG